MTTDEEQLAELYAADVQQGYEDALQRKLDNAHHLDVEIDELMTEMQATDDLESVLAQAKRLRRVSEEENGLHHPTTPQ